MVSVAFSIDVAYLLYYGLAHGKLHKERLPKSSVSDFNVAVVIPTRNDSKGLENTIYSIMSQTHLPKKIVIMDDGSTDDTSKIGMEFAKENSFLINYVKFKKHHGKAAGINYAVNCLIDEEFTWIVDGDTIIDSSFLEDMLTNFESENIAAVTAGGTTIPRGRWIDKELSYGKDNMMRIFAFRKKSQNLRNAIAVMNGSSPIYRTSVLKQIPYRNISLAEDQDHTWLVLENKNSNNKPYEIIYDPRHKDTCNDKIGAIALTMQAYRWYRGTWQNLYNHLSSGNLNKAPLLFYTSLIPSFFDSVTYGVAISTIPILVTLALPGIEIVAPSLIAKGIIGDLLLTYLTTAILNPKGLKHPVGVIGYKSLAVGAYISAALITSYEYFSNTANWGNKWQR